MVDRKLVAYVREQLHRGYSTASIKAVLIQSGYDPRDVERTFRSVRYKPFLVGTCIILVLFVVVGFIFSLLSSFGGVITPLPYSKPVSDAPAVQNIPSSTDTVSLSSTRVAQSNFRVVSHETPPNIPLPPIPDNDFHDIIQLARENPHKARTLCIALNSLTDSCLLASGLATSQSDFCTDIRDGDKRDSCYFNIIISTKEHQLCSSLTNPHLLDTCAQLS